LGCHRTSRRQNARHGHLASYLAACVDHREVLAPGERGVIPLLAASTQQAASAFAFIEGIFAVAPNLKDLVDGATSDTLSLTTGIDIQVRPASYRTIRGITAVAAICDEISFWRSDDAANPDREIMKALRPSLATTNGPLICISSPHAKRGELYSTFKRHFGPNGHPLILVAKAPSLTMNPSLAQSVVDRAYEADPDSASAEYGAEFRSDLEVFITRDSIEACVASGVLVRAPLDGVSYAGFVDPSGGSSDSMTLSVAHNENGHIILDCIVERKPPFSPDSVVSEFAETLRTYRILTVIGDRYAGEWPRERFAVRGVTYKPADMTRSELYLAFLPLLNSGRLDLLDNQRMIAQFVGLERRVSSSGRDSVNHTVGSHDDVSNCVAGAIVAAQGRTEPGFLTYMRAEVGFALQPAADRRQVKLRVPPNISHIQTMSGRHLGVPVDRIIDVSEDDAAPLVAQSKFERVSIN
jgi:hypothetical protein